jgi:hypothetical protein
VRSGPDLKRSGRGQPAQRIHVPVNSGTELRGQQGEVLRREQNHRADYDAGILSRLPVVAPIRDAARDRGCSASIH